MKYEIEIPDGVLPPGVVPVAFRSRNTGESFISDIGILCNAASSEGGFPRLIVRRELEPMDWQPPSWLKDCWLATDYLDDGRTATYVYEKRPRMEHGTAHSGGHALCVRESSGPAFSPWNTSDFPFINPGLLLRVEGGKAFLVID